MTIFPAARAGWMTSRTSCARAVLYSRACAFGASGMSCRASPTSRTRSGGDRVDRLGGFLERDVLGCAAELEHARERARDLGGRVAPRHVDRNAVGFGVAEPRSLAPVVVLQGDDDVGVLGLAHDRDR